MKLPAKSNLRPRRCIETMTARQTRRERLMIRLARWSALAGMELLAGTLPAMGQQKLPGAAYGGVWDSHLREKVFPDFEKKHNVKIDYVAGNSTYTLHTLHAHKTHLALAV